MMRFKRSEKIGLLFGALSVAGSSVADEIIYKCIDAQGRVTFSQCPCSEAAQEVLLHAYPATEHREATPADIVEQHQALSQRLHLRSIEDQLRRREGDLDSLCLARDRKLAELQRQAAEAAGGPGYYTMQDRIKALQDATRLEYDSKISQAQRDIARLQAQLSRAQPVQTGVEPLRAPDTQVQGPAQQHEVHSQRPHLRSIEDQLRRREGELDSLCLARDRKLAELERQAAEAAGRPGYYKLQDRIRALQDATRLEYDSKISQAQRDIARLRAELSGTR